MLLKGSEGCEIMQDLPKRLGANSSNSPRRRLSRLHASILLATFSFVLGVQLAYWVMSVDKKGFNVLAPEFFSVVCLALGYICLIVLLVQDGRRLEGR